MQRRVDPLLADDAWLRAFLRRRVAPADVDDVAQATWLAALQRPQRCRPVLAGIARRLAALWHRGRVRRAAREHAVGAGRTQSSPSAQTLAEHRETIDLVVRAVAALPEPYRATLLQYYQDGASVAEIAHREGLAELAIRKRLQRARDRVRADVEAAARAPRRRGGLLLGWLVPRRVVPAVLVLAGAAAIGLGLVLGAGDAERVGPVRADTVAAAPTEPSVVAADVPSPVARREVVAAAGDAERPSAVPPTEWRLAVTVRGVDGEPLTGAVVRCGHENAWTDAQGVARLKLNGDLTAQPDRISARYTAPAGPAGDRPRFLRVQDGLRECLPAAGGDTALELRFDAALLCIRGAVVDATGAPVARAIVFLAEAEPLDPACPPDGVQQPLEDLATAMEGEVLLGEGRCESSLFAVTDADGAFVLPGLRPRPYVLRVVHWASWRAAVSAPVVAGADGVHITLPDAPPRRLHGRVVDPGGRGLADVRVVALLPLLRVGGTAEHVVVAESSTDAAGAFEFDAPASVTEVGVRSPALLRAQQPIASGDGAQVLCTDVPHTIELDTAALPTAASWVEVLDIAERPVASLVPGERTIGMGRHLLPRAGVLQLHTRRDAAVARLGTADGRVVQLVPLVPVAAR